MITTIRRLCNLVFFLLLFIVSHSQELRSYNQNSARSNHAKALSIFISPVYSSATNNNKDSLLFRGSGSGLRVGGDYFFGRAGIGFSTGFSSSSTSDAAINGFLKNAAVPPDQMLITKAKQQNMYLLVGPSVRVGNKVELYAHAKGGLFINNGGLVSIQQRGAVRAAYRNESTDKNMYPGFLTGLSVQYKTKSDLWAFGIGADYMSTRSEVNNYDARRGNGVEGLKLSGNIRDIVAGVSVRYNILSPRDHASGQSTGRVLPTVNKRELSAREASSGLATGKRAVNKREIAIDEPGITNSTTGCGPVTKKITFGDGSTEEMTFACPADALAYERQTPKRDFGEKHAADNTNEIKKTFPAPHVFESKGIISGTLTWSSSGSAGIISNAVISNSSPRSGSATLNSQSSSTRTTNQSSFGTMVRLSAREAGSGLATGKRAREASSGQATGRRQYEPVFAEGKADVCNPCLATVKMSAANTNPLYNDKSVMGNNPFYSDNKRTSGGDEDCDGVAGADIYLIDVQSREVVAKTKTEQCGDFFFANVPRGNYVVRVAAVLAGKKGYDVYLKSKTDLLGSISHSDDWMQLTINTSTDDNNSQKAGISTSRSNLRTKSISIIEADLDGDGEFESIRATGMFSDGTARDLTNDARMEAIANTPGSKGIVLRSSAFTTRRRVEVLKSNRQADLSNKSISTIAIVNSGNQLRAIASFTDGSSSDVTDAITANTTQSNVRQYTIIVADLDGDGVAEAVVKTKTKSNQSNDRVAAGDLDGDGIWSPRSNIKMIRVAAGDINGDGAMDLTAGNLRTEFAVLRDRNKTYFETGDIPTEQQRSVVGGLVPGGSILSAAMRPGDPVPDIDITIKQNSTGQLSGTTHTNENGEFEFMDLKEGEYTIALGMKYYLDDETFVTVDDGVTGKSAAGETDLKNIAARNKDVKVTATQNSQSLRYQNNNTVRSNRTGNALLINDGSNDPDDITIDEGGVSKPKEKPGQLKWMAPESMKKAINTSHSNLKNMLSSLSALEQQLDADAINSKSVINTSRSNIKSQRTAISEVENILDNLQVREKTAAMNELDQKINAMNMQFLALRESVIQMGGQYNSISNVLKTRHETAMASIRNLK